MPSAGLALATHTVPPSSESAKPTIWSSVRVSSRKVRPPSSERRSIVPKPAAERTYTTSGSSGSTAATNELAPERKAVSRATSTVVMPPSSERRSTAMPPRTKPET